MHFYTRKNPDGFKLLFAQLVVDDSVRTFLIDTGSDSSYFFKDVISAQPTGKEIECTWWIGPKKAKEVNWKGSLYYVMDTVPEAVEQICKVYNVLIFGLLGLNFLLDRKIILDFRKV